MYKGPHNVDAYMKVLVPFIVVGKPSRQMGSNKADRGIGIFHSNSHGTLIACHARQPSLLRRAFNMLDEM
jgi:hypothetical protein